MELAIFALTMAVGQLTPGPDMLLILKNTLNHGLRTGLATIAGICLGIIAHVTLVLTGSAVLLESLPWLYRSIQFLGAAYLLWVASKLIRSLRSSTDLNVAGRTGNRPFASAFREGLLTNLSNVKVIVLFSSLLAPIAADPSRSAWPYGLLIIAEALLIWPIFAWLMQRPLIRDSFLKCQRGLNLAFAMLLIAFAIKLLWT